MNLVLDLFKSFAVIGKIVGDLDENLLFDHPEINLAYLFGICGDGAREIGYRRGLVTSALKDFFNQLAYMLALGVELDLSSVQGDRVLMEGNFAFFDQIIQTETKEVCRQIAEQPGTQFFPRDPSLKWILAVESRRPGHDSLFQPLRRFGENEYGGSTGDHGELPGRGQAGTQLDEPGSGEADE